MEKQATCTPHVLIFPFPIQSHVSSMLNLAELLTVTADVTVTFINSEYNHQRLLRYADISSRFDRIRFVTVPDGLPLDQPRTGHRVGELFFTMGEATRPVFRELVVNAESRIDCIIGDGILGFVSDIADELGINLIHFRTASASSFWVYYSIPHIIKAGELPIKGSEDMDRRITTVPGMETFLRCRDLPSFCRVSDSDDPVLEFVAAQTRRSSKTIGLIFNTFEDMEGPALSHIRENCPKVYTVGPLHQRLKTRVMAARDVVMKSSVNNSFWEIDRSCIQWLDQQPEKSVVYVSFGSIATITSEQLMEFWHGLVGSNQKFLWVLRPNLMAEIQDEENIPADLAKGTTERGCIVGWAPQGEVLAHQATGGFLTHGGWNSILESMLEGVPMLCWPCIADQQVNSRFLSEIWKMGLDMKDLCDRKAVEKMVNVLMVERREELAESTAGMARLAKQSVLEGGSSYCNLDRLIEDLRSMTRHE